MQAGNVDTAAEMNRKVRNRCRRAKGRIQKQASTGADSRTSTWTLIRSRAKPAAGSEGPTSRRLRMPRSGRACRLENKLP